LLCLLPGGEETSNAIGAEVFENLGPTGIFINVGRGSSVDEEALVTALEAGLIAGAGLDVYAHEPAVPEALLSMEQVVLFPHIGTSTVETRCEMGNLLIRNLQAFFDNKALISEVNL
jgi:lactate dehydrogenase-like 2-hydroxyacid dehydrogenase